MATEEKAFFLQPTSLLPNESILWRGKPSAKARQVLLIEILICITIAAAFLGLGLYGVSYLNKLEAKHPAPVTAMASPTPSSAPSPVSAEGSSAHQRRSGDMPLVAILFPVCFVGLLMTAFFLLALLMALIRTVTSAYMVTTERILFFTGWLNKSALTLDLDKVISVKASSSWLDRAFKLYSIELTHAGNNMMSPRNPWLMYNPYSIVGIPLDEPLHDKISNHWLPRDNRVNSNGSI